MKQGTVWLVLAVLTAGCTAQSGSPDDVEGGVRDAVLRVDDAFTYADADGHAFSLRVEAPVTVRTLDGAAHEAVPVRAVLETGSEHVLTISTGTGTGLGVANGCWMKEESCMDWYAFQPTAHAPAMPPLFLGQVDRILTTAAAGDHLEVPTVFGGIPYNAPYDVAAADHATWGDCLRLTLADEIHDYPADMTFAEFRVPVSVLLCEGVAAPVEVAVGLDGSVVHTLTDAIRGSSPLPLPWTPRAVATTAPAPDAFAEADGLPPAGDAPTGYVPLHEAYAHAVDRDTDLRAFLEAHPDAILHDFRALGASVGDVDPAPLHDDRVRLQYGEEHALTVATPDGDAAHRVVVAKRTTGGALDRWHVTESGDVGVMAPPATPSGPMLTLHDGARLAQEALGRDVVNVDVAAAHRMPGADPAPDRYRYEYRINAMDGSDPFPERVSVDAATGEIVEVVADGATLSAFTPLPGEDAAG